MARCAARPPEIPITLAMVGSTRSGSRTGARGIQKTPSLNSSMVAATTAMQVASCRSRPDRPA